MTLDRLSQAVREQLTLGRLLPLGAPEDGVWLAESAARGALRHTVGTAWAGAAASGGEPPGCRLGALRITSAAAQEPATPHDTSFARPPGALPPGPLRIEAEFAAPVGQPIPDAAARLRDTLFAAAVSGLGLPVEAVDLRVSELFAASEARDVSDRDREPSAGRAAHKGHERYAEPSTDRSAALGALAVPQDAKDAEQARAGAGSDETRVAAAVRAVPGVARLSGRIGGLGRAVHIERPVAEDAAPPAPRVRVEVALERTRPPVEAARAIRAAVTAVLPGEPAVTVLITDLT